MLTTEQCDRIQNRLRNSGLNAEVVEYEGDGDDAYEPFTAQIERNPKKETLVLYAGSVDIQAFTDTRHKRAIIWADEPSRQFTKAVRYSGQLGIKGIKSRWEAGRDFPIGFPVDGVKYEILENPQQDKTPVVGSGNWKVYIGKVRASVPATKLTLMVGIDETHMFLCGLPKRVKTVKEAHEALRPKGVPANAPRQGEWFFVPVTDDERELLETAMRTGFTDKGKRHPVGPMWLSDDDNEYPWETGNPYSGEGFTHAAFTSAFLGRRQYVIGYVIDDRGSDPSRHEPLWLHDWHRAVHNLELAVPGDDDTWD